MKIFNEQKTQEVLNPDLAKGTLKADKLLIRTIPAIIAVEENWHYEKMPADASGGYELKRVIDVMGVIGKPAENIYEDIQIYIPFTPEQIEQQKKSRRTVYLDAYRKYQAAINYGEFERVPAVDTFIAALRNKNWQALDYIPPQIKYFTGEVSFAQSGLVPKQGY